MLYIVGSVADGTYGATAADWAAMLDAVSGSPFPGDAFANEYGQGFTIRPIDLAAQIIGGITWIDYCRWPLYDPIGLLVLTGAGGFQAFTQSIFGYPLAYGRQAPQFLPPASPLYVPGGYGSALFTTVDILHTAGVALPFGYVPSTQTVSEFSAGHTVYAAPMFGIRAGKGWYFWATPGVTGNTYGTWISAVLVSPGSFLRGGGVSGGVPPATTPPSVPGSSPPNTGVATPPPPPPSRTGIYVAAGALAAVGGIILAGQGAAER